MVALLDCLLGSRKLGPREAQHSLLGYMIMLSMIMEADNGPELVRFLVCIVGAILPGVGSTLLYGAYLHASLRRENHIVTVKRKGPIDVIELPESPPRTRSSQLLSSESHRRMAQSLRARRRGGSRRHRDHRRTSTRIFNPSAEHHCGYACLLKAKGLTPSRRRIHELQHATAEAVHAAYLADHYVEGMSDRHMVQDTHRTLRAYVARVKWNLWASPIELCYAADSLDISIAVLRLVL